MKVLLVCFFLMADGTGIWETKGFPLATPCEAASNRTIFLTVIGDSVRDAACMCVNADKVGAKPS